MDSRIDFDPELIQRYDTTGPRYTSYPTANLFHAGVGEEDYRKLAHESNGRDEHGAPKPLSLYFHIPFCDTLCFYCGCNKVVTKDRSKARPYLDHLYKEMAMQSELFDADRPVEQLHWGGGTPTFISAEEMRELMATTGKYFKLLDDDSGQYSIEIDPREVTPDSVALLRELGFNRLSMGVQDFDPGVQKAVHRIQSVEETVSAIEAARANDFKSVSIDLIYGLPLQTVEKFDKTLDTVIAANPDRLSVFNYAHLPEMFKPQRRINADELPSPAEKLAILQHTMARLAEAGYMYIGMDHFAKPDDELAVAQANGSLYRNFQGYSTHAECDLVAMGITSISKVGNSYTQNVKSLDEYYQRIAAGQLPVFRGIIMNDDDVLRYQVITRLMCNFRLAMADIDNEFGIRFEDYFSEAMQAMEQMQTDGLLTLSNREIVIHDKGRFLIRNICMLFDAYLKGNKEQRFSKVI